MPSDATISELPQEAAPLDEAVPCPLCHYDLRGLTEPRCPECGFRFTWPELLDPARRLHPYLFEHHPERNVWSFFRTAWGGLRPKKFWTNLHPAQPSRPKRLIAYQLCVMGLLGFVFGVAYLRSAFDVAKDMQGSRAWFTARINAAATNPGSAPWVNELIQKHGSAQAAIDAIAPHPTLGQIFGEIWRHRSLRRELVRIGMMLTIPFFIWPFLTYFSLMVFRWSMRRARVDPVHVLRCVTYSSDFAVAAALALGMALLFVPFVYNASGALDEFGLGVCAISILVFMYRLQSAYRRYLRFDRPLATIMASQVIVFLSVLFIVAMLVPVWFRVWS